MVDKLQLKRSITAGYVPPVGSLSEGELLINLPDKAIYTSDDKGAIISVGGGGGGSGSGLPVGAITAFPTATMPTGFLVCDGSTFNNLEYPDLFKVLGNNILPDLRGKYLKGVSGVLSPLTTVPWVMPDHTHEGTGTTSVFDHGNKASSSVTLNKAFGSNTTGNHTHKMYGGHQGGWTSANVNADAKNRNTSYQPVTQASGNHSHSTTVNFGAHSHSVAIGSHSHTLNLITTGIRESTIHKGDTLDVDHVTVVYGIKAAGYVTNEGLASVEGMKITLEEIKKQQQEFNGSVVGSEQQFPPLPVGKTPGEMWVAKDGSELQRSSYPALWAWAQSAGIVVTEEEWQRLKETSHGGAVAIYSSGDGATTFRVPDVGTFGMVQRPLPKGLGEITSAYFIGYSDQNKSHAHTISSFNYGTKTSGGNGSHNHAMFSNEIIQNRQDQTGRGTICRTLYNSASLEYSMRVGNGRASTGLTSDDGAHTHSVGIGAHTHTIGSEGGDEARMKHMWCSIWIYSGNNLTVIPLPTPDYIKQIDKNKADIADHETRIDKLEQGGSGGGSGSGVPEYKVITSDTTAVSGRGYAVKLSTEAISVRLPLNPTIGSVIYVKDYEGKCSQSLPIVITTVDKIHGSDENLILVNPNISVVLSYVDSLQGWQVVDGIGESGCWLTTPDKPFFYGWLNVPSGWNAGAVSRRNGIFEFTVDTTTTSRPEKINGFTISNGRVVVPEDGYYRSRVSVLSQISSGSAYLLSLPSGTQHGWIGLEGAGHQMTDVIAEEIAYLNKGDSIYPIIDVRNADIAVWNGGHASYIVEKVNTPMLEVGAGKSGGSSGGGGGSSGSPVPYMFARGGDVTNFAGIQKFYFHEYRGYGISYDPTTRDFTVLEDGVYEVIHTCLASSTTTARRVMLSKNRSTAPSSGDKTTFFAQMYDGGQSHGNLAASGMIECRAGDTIQSWNSGGEFYLGNVNDQDWFNQITIKKVDITSGGSLGSGGSGASKMTLWSGSATNGQPMDLNRSYDLFDEIYVEGHATVGGQNHHFSGTFDKNSLKLGDRYYIVASSNSAASGSGAAFVNLWFDVMGLNTFMSVGSNTSTGWTNVALTKVVGTKYGSGGGTSGGGDEKVVDLLPSRKGQTPWFYASDDYDLLESIDSFDYIEVDFCFKENDVYSFGSRHYDKSILKAGQNLHYRNTGSAAETGNVRIVSLTKLSISGSGTGGGDTVVQAIRGVRRVSGPVEGTPGGETVLWFGSAKKDATLKLTRDIEEFDAIRLEGKGAGWRDTNTVSVDSILEGVTVPIFVTLWTNTDYVGVQNWDLTNRTVKVIGTTGTSSEVNKIIGIKYGSGGGNCSGGKTLIWSGDGSTDNQVLTFSDPLSNFDEILIEAYAFATDLGTSKSYSPETMLRLKRVFVERQPPNSIDLQLKEITNTSCKVSRVSSVNTSGSAVQRIWGITHGGTSVAPATSSGGAEIVDILPFSEIGYGSKNYFMPSGHKLKDFDYIEWGIIHDSSATNISSTGTGIITKAQLQGPTATNYAYVSYKNPNNTYLAEARWEKVSEEEFSLLITAGSTTGAKVSHMRGFKFSKSSGGSGGGDSKFDVLYSGSLGNLQVGTLSNSIRDYDEVIVTAVSSVATVGHQHEMNATFPTNTLNAVSRYLVGDYNTSATDIWRVWIDFPSDTSIKPVVGNGTGWTPPVISQVIGVKYGSGGGSGGGSSADTAWNVTPFASGWTSLPGWTCKYKRKGGVVYVRGLAKKEAGATNHVITLPVGFRPVETQMFATNMSTGYSDVSRIDVTNDGKITFHNFGASGLTWVNMTLSFPTD